MMKKAKKAKPNDANILNAIQANVKAVCHKYNAGTSCSYEHDGEHTCIYFRGQYGNKPLRCRYYEDYVLSQERNLLLETRYYAEYVNPISEGSVLDEVK